MAQQARAMRDQTAALQTQSGIDTASIMSRYGSFAALGGSGASPLTAAPNPAMVNNFGFGLLGGPLMQMNR